MLGAIAYEIIRNLDIWKTHFQKKKTNSWRHPNVSQFQNLRPNVNGSKTNTPQPRLLLNVMNYFSV